MKNYITAERITEIREMLDEGSLSDDGEREIWEAAQDVPELAISVVALADALTLAEAGLVSDALDRDWTLEQISKDKLIAKVRRTLAKARAA